MKFEIVFSLVICIGVVLPSIACYEKGSGVRRVSYNPKKINQTGEYQYYYGYSIIAMIDTNLIQVAKEIEAFIRTSSYNKTYSALPAKTYHMSIYTIFSLGNKLIPPIQRWVDEKPNRTIPAQGYLPHEVLEEQNDKATCTLRKYLNETLYIKRASLNIGDRIIGLTLELEEESLQRIRNARRKLAKVYEHPNRSMEPIEKKLHITFGYVYGEVDTFDINDYNYLTWLVQSFNGAKFMPPSVYLYMNMKKYYPFKLREFVNCDAYEW